MGKATGLINSHIFKDSAGKFVEPFKKFQPKDSFITSLVSLLVSIPKLSVFTALLPHNSASVCENCLMNA